MKIMVDWVHPFELLRKAVLLFPPPPPLTANSYDFPAQFFSAEVARTYRGYGDDSDIYDLMILMTLKKNWTVYVPH